MIKIDGYPIDLALTEDHSFTSEVTEYPVESGADISDNIRNKPLEITLEGVISDTPIGAIAQDATRRQDTGSALPSRDAYTRLIAIRDAREPVAIETGLGKFERMVLTSLSIPRDRATGKALKFTATFRQVVIVTNARITVAGKVNGGNRQPKTGVNGKPNPKALEAKPIWVKSWPLALRATFEKNGERPILTTTSAQRKATGGKRDPFAPQVGPGAPLGYQSIVRLQGYNTNVMDHYKLVKGEEVADGYVQRAPDGKDYFFGSGVKVDRSGRTSGQSERVATRTQSRVNGRDVVWDPGTNEWKDAKTGETVRKVPPNEDRWKGVQWRTLPTHKEPTPWEEVKPF